MPDTDNVLPITDDEYFQDDIVARLVDFLRTVYGEETLSENLTFIADALSPAAEAAPLEVIRAYFLKGALRRPLLNLQEAPHLLAARRPGKEEQLQGALLHAPLPPRPHGLHPHRLCAPATGAPARRIADAEEELVHCEPRRKAALNKKLKLLHDQEAELIAYEEKIDRFADQMIAIDLDDGVKTNYATFQDVLAKVK